jgi:hypothetical protein
MDILGTIATVIDLSQKIINYVQDVKGGKEDRKKLLAEVIGLKTLLPFLEHRANVSPRTIDTLSIPLRQCKDALVDLETKLRTAVRKERKLMWPFTKKTIVDELIQIERLKSYITLVFQDRLVWVHPYRSSLNVTSILREMMAAIHNDLKDVGTGISGLASGMDTISVSQRGAPVCMSISSSRTRKLDISVQFR